MVTFRIFKQYIPAALAALAFIETLVFIASAYAAIYVRFYSGAFFSGEVQSVPGLLNVLVFTVVLGASLTSVGLYQRRTRLAIAGILVRLTLGFFTAIIALSFIYYLFPNIEMGRGVLALALIFAFSGMLISRMLFVAVTNQDALKRRVLILGAGKRASSFNTLQQQVGHKGFNVIGFIHLRGDHDAIDETKLIKKQAPLCELVESYEVDEIVVAVDDRRKDFPLDDLLDCKLQGVDVVDLQTFFERETGKIKLDLFHPSHFIFSDGFNQSLLQDVLKRTFDIVSSSILLLMTFPIMLIAAVLVKVEDGGPVFFQQIRVGKDSAPYKVLKFRSMRVDAESDGKARWATKNDSRTTKIGDFIRKVRIDELPQIYNVLKGEMSFVGPRPERPEFASDLSGKIPYYQERHRVKPGITGWAQVCYPYGASDNDSYEKLQYDLYYAKNHNVFLDLTILMQTAEVILFGRGR